MAEWTLDSGFYLDQHDEAEIEAEIEVSMDTQFVFHPFDDLEVVFELDTSMDFQHSVVLDLLRLLPIKFHSSQIFLDYIDEVELEVGSWLTSVRDMVKLANPNTVTSRDYLKHLAALIGLDLPPEDDSTEAEIRRSIAQAIDWYKVKGTYQSVNIISMIEQFTINLFDMYTNDYSTFYITDWFVGEEDENPAGFDSTYYKSPHFGLEIVLDRTYSVGTGGASGGSGVSSLGGSGSFLYLWETSYLDNLFDAVEQTRPVHTVPHYVLLLSPTTDEFGNVIQTDGNIQTKILGTWEVSTKYFDMTPSWNFDAGENFDASTEAFIRSINTWVLGIGTANINSSSWTLANPVLTGSIQAADIVITDEKITFSFIVPRSVIQKGITELGLYTSGGILVLGSTFPIIDLDSRVELRVVVSVYKSDLSS